jgi:hypothetical protein
MDFSDKKLLFIGYNLLENKFSFKDRIFKFNAVGIKVIDLRDALVFDLDFEECYKYIRDGQIKIKDFYVGDDYELKTSYDGKVYLEFKHNELDDLEISSKMEPLFYENKLVYGERKILIKSYLSGFIGFISDIKDMINVYVDLETFDLGMTIKGEIVYWHINEDIKDCNFDTYTVLTSIWCDGIFNSHILNGGAIVFDKCVYVCIKDTINSDIIIPNGIEKVIVDTSDNRISLVKSNNDFRLVCPPSLKEFELNYLVNDMHSKFIFSSKSKDTISSVDFGDNEVEFYG